MNAPVEYLLSFLSDELRDYPGLRIHAVAPTGFQKSPDLPQDYDPEEGRVHLNSGVRVRISSREYFFPAEWVEEGRFDQVQSLALEIRSYLESKET
jgi:hypothetical protein